MNLRGHQKHWLLFSTLRAELFVLEVLKPSVMKFPYFKEWQKKLPARDLGRLSRGSSTSVMKTTGNKWLQSKFRWPQMERISMSLKLRSSYTRWLYWRINLMSTVHFQSPREQLLYYAGHLMATISSLFNPAFAVRDFMGNGLYTWAPRL